MNACYDDAALQRLFAGELEPRESEVLELHLLECRGCVDRVNSLCAVDPLLSLLRAAGEKSAAVGSNAVHSLLAALRDRSSLSTDGNSQSPTRTFAGEGRLDLSAFLNRLSPPAAEDELGRLGPFRLLKLLGAGGMGMVFAAEDTGLGRQVALKTLRPELLSDDQAIQRFLAEARAAARVRNPHVITVHQVGVIDGVPFFVQELLQGESLDVRCSRAPCLSPGDVVRIGRELMAGLAAAHERGLLHRDIKPGNIWLESPGESVRLLDFGLARVVEGTGQLTAVGVLVGTPAYMSPEQAEGLPLDARSDLFSAGVVLYQLATGRRPFEGATTLAVLKALATVVPPPARTLNTQISQGLSDLIDRLLAKDRNQRPAGAQEAAGLLENLESTPGGSSAPPAQGRPPHATVLAWGGAALALLAGIVIILISRDGSRTRIEVAEGTAVRIEASARPATAAPSSPAGDSTALNTRPEGPEPPQAAPKPAVAPFDSAAAKRHQEAWAAFLDLPVEFTNSLGMTFRLIPAGEYVRGSPAEDAAYWMQKVPAAEATIWPEFLESAIPSHRVILTDPFYLSAYETTQQQYAEVMGTNPSYFSGSGRGQDQIAGLNTARHPVEQVTWHEARTFCARLAARERLSAFPEDSVIDDSKYDRTTCFLPTEAQWEFACRAGTTTRFWTGDDDGALAPAGWTGQNSERRTHAVGTRLPNPFGLCDMHGNVFEYCEDWFHRRAYQPFSDRPAIDPQGMEFSNNHRKVVRGGSYFEDPVASHSSLRRTSTPNGRGKAVGFRAAMTTESVRKLLHRGRTPAGSSRAGQGPAVAAPAPAAAPFDAAQARAHQERWAEYLELPAELTNSLGMSFRLIPPGEYVQGSPAEDVDYWLRKLPPAEEPLWRGVLQSAAPPRRVVLTRPYYLSMYETTQRQYAALMGTNPSAFSPDGAEKNAVGNEDTRSFPVDGVSWHDAKSFCTALAAREELAPAPSATRDAQQPFDRGPYRLPTEAEWEFACRAGTVTRYWTGDDDASLDAAAWHGVNSGKRTHAVGTRAPNPFGLYDVHGNLFEWCEDQYDPEAFKAAGNEAAVDPFVYESASVFASIHRGGNFFEDPVGTHSAFRRSSHPDGKGSGIGFRVVLSIEAARAAFRTGKLTAGARTPWQGWPADAPRPARIPFDARQAARFQAEWAEYLDLPVQYINTAGMKLRLIPPGEYLRGSTSEQIEKWMKDVGRTDGSTLAAMEGEGPPHRVVLTRPFYLAATETTRAQYAAVARNSGMPTFSEDRPSDGADGDRSQHPAADVSWFDSIAFCNMLSQDEQLAPCYERTGDSVSIAGGDGYRLPSEAEWEFACRAGSPSLYWNGDWGDERVNAIAWVNSNSGSTLRAVALLTPNPFGLFDVHGNVREWCEDWLDASYYRRFVDRPAVDPRGPESSSLGRRVNRGGSALARSLHARSSHRAGSIPDGRSPQIGFRVALSADAVRKAIGKIEIDNAEKRSWRGWPPDAPPPARSPFDAKQAAQHQEAWAKYLAVPVEYTNPRGMKYRLIPPGEYARGSTREQLEIWLNRLWQTDAESRANLEGEGPPHTVVLTRPFYVAVTETTRRNYAAIMGNDPTRVPAHFASSPEAAGEDLLQWAVSRTSWLDAVEFCIRLSQEDGLSACYRRNDDNLVIVAGEGYRLPSEAEWEYVCRAGATTSFWTGDEADEAFLAAAWVKTNSGKRIHPVGTRAANAFGLFDVHGNTREWCEDWLDLGYYGQFAGQPAINPRGPDSSPLGKRVNRGGSAVSWEGTARAAHRFNPIADTGNLESGFRTVLSVEGVRKALAKAK
jgi:formylglycine-generating enzyme required for sulfatase activity/tRNA A-37 threonylcarbamoyl transferase component Bud32